MAPLRRAVALDPQLELARVNLGGALLASGDLSAAAAQLTAALRINPDNLGFSRGCNVGAGASTGGHLLFLNNDMKVLEGWLDPLVSTLKRDPEVGVVGGKPSGPFSACHV